jgi:hypothetical protein
MPANPKPSRANCARYSTTTDTAGATLGSTPARSGAPNHGTYKAGSGGRPLALIEHDFNASGGNELWVADSFSLCC